GTVPGEGTCERGPEVALCALGAPGDEPVRPHEYGALRADAVEAGDVAVEVDAGAVRVERHAQPLRGRHGRRAPVRTVRACHEREAAAEQVERRGPCAVAVDPRVRRPHPRLSARLVGVLPEDAVVAVLASDGAGHVAVAELDR